MAARIELEPRDHVVQFYERGDELVGAVSGVVGAALTSGDAVVVVATPDHRAGFAAALDEAGIDVAAARGAGLLLEADAAATLARFVHEEGIDADAFDDIVGGLVREASAGGTRSVRVYGEMVALLWEAGSVAAAVALEELWNGLATRVPFSLLCAYPAPAVDDDASLAALARVCHLHSAVVGTPPRIDRDVRTFEHSTFAPRAARHFVADTLEAWGREDLIDDASVVVTELATNAIVHTGRGFDASVTRGGDDVWIAVTDRSSAAPLRRDPPAGATTGRGLALVDALSSHWGYELLGNGKRVWAELRGT
jgi:anti-sigma regulatory factor (Ser/Thr protein kinase)